MSLKKQGPSLCKFYSFYEEINQRFSDESDVDSYFYHNMKISQSQHRTVRISKGSNKKSFPFKLIEFCDLKTQQRCTLQDQVNVSKKELRFSVVSLRDFLKSFDKANECLQIPLPKPETELGYTKSKQNIFVYFCKNIIEHPNSNNRLSFRFGNNNSYDFSIKTFETTD